jgi:hypothetical protein
LTASQPSHVNQQAINIHSFGSPRTKPSLIERIIIVWCGNRFEVELNYMPMIKIIPEGV